MSIFPIAIILLCVGSIPAILAGSFAHKVGRERGLEDARAIPPGECEDCSRLSAERDALARALHDQSEECETRKVRASCLDRHLGHFHDLARERGISAEIEPQGIVAALRHQLTQCAERGEAAGYSRGHEDGKRIGLAQAVMTVQGTLDRLAS